MNCLVNENKHRIQRTNLDVHLNSKTEQALATQHFCTGVGEIYSHNLKSNDLYSETRFWATA